jgi:hypothetical protein
LLSSSTGLLAEQDQIGIFLGDDLGEQLGDGEGFKLGIGFDQNAAMGRPWRAR